MPKRAVVSTMAVALLFVALCRSHADSRIYVPGVRIVLEVRTAQGDLRSYQQPGERPTYWEQAFPVVKGDRVTIDAFVATGGAELEEVRIRLDDSQIASRLSAPWRVEVDTGQLEIGRHLVEAWAATKAPHSRHNSAASSFLVLPQSERLPLASAGATSESDLPVTGRERLACAIGSLDPEVDREIGERSSATVSEPAFFFAAAGPEATEFFYELSREEVEVPYTSPRLPLATSILVEPSATKGQAPARDETEPEKAGVQVPPETEEDLIPRLLRPGEVTLTMVAVDGLNRLGPPASVTLHIMPEEGEK